MTTEETEREIVRLKAQAYDHIAGIEFHQKGLAETNAQIARLSQQRELEAGAAGAAAENGGD